jgi:hypothetical protein
MESNTIESNSTGRHVVGVRALPKLKQELANEAADVGLTLSEYCESILANRHAEGPEMERLRNKVAEQQREIEKLNASLLIKPEPVQAAPILSDQRLLYLYEKLKGKPDKVENAYGDDFAITYNTPQDVLIAIIYSTQLNQ